MMREGGKMHKENRAIFNRWSIFRKTVATRFIQIEKRSFWFLASFRLSYRLPFGTRSFAKELNMAAAGSLAHLLRKAKGNLKHAIMRDTFLTTRWTRHGSV